MTDKTIAELLASVESAAPKKVFLLAVEVNQTYVVALNAESEDDAIQFARANLESLDLNEPFFEAEHVVRTLDHGEAEQVNDDDRDWMRITEVGQ